MQIAPAVEMSPAQDAADGGRTESGVLGNLISRTMLAAELDYPRGLARRSGARTAMRTRGAVKLGASTRHGSSEEMQDNPTSSRRDGPLPARSPQSLGLSGRPGTRACAFQ